MKFLEKFKPFSGLHWTTTFKVLLKRTEEHGFGMMTLLTLPFLIPVRWSGFLHPEYRVFPTRVQLVRFPSPWLPQRIVRLHLSPALSTGLLKILTGYYIP